MKHFQSHAALKAEERWRWKRYTVQPGGTSRQKFKNFNFFRLQRQTGCWFILEQIWTLLLFSKTKLSNFRDLNKRNEASKSINAELLSDVFSQFSHGSNAAGDQTEKDSLKERHPQFLN